MKFTKMQGCGNDYVYVNCFEEEVQDPAALAVQVSDRHFGIGSDGLILVKPSEQADCMMDMYNADGSRGAMCGNGIRCVAKLAYESGIVKSERITVETMSGIKTLDLTVKDGKVTHVRVDMGEPELCAEKIPVIREKMTPGRDAKNGPDGEDKDMAVNAPIEADGRNYEITAVSMGNPHAVVFIGDAAAAPGSKRNSPDTAAAAGLALDTLKIGTLGPYFENHPAFPDRVNTEFAEVIDEQTLRMRVWERGSGETLACGTGACATAVAAMLTERVPGRRATVQLRGGELVIEWDEETGHVFMTGPAVTVFTGEIDI